MAYAPPNGPAEDKNAHRRSIIRIIRPINGSFVGRIQYAPTQRHKNAARFSHATTVKQSNAPRFTYFIPDMCPLGYIAIVERLRSAAFHAFHGMA